MVWVQTGHGFPNSVSELTICNPRLMVSCRRCDQLQLLLDPAQLEHTKQKLKELPPSRRKRLLSGMDTDAQAQVLQGLQEHELAEIPLGFV